MAALIAQLRDFDLAEEAFSDAMIEAARVWPDKGMPDNGGAWLLAVAKRRAIDRLRKLAVRQSDTAQATIQQLAEDTEMAEADYTIPDERLRLIFTCCHPALSREAQVALTLRTLCGLTSREIARAFLTSETTMNQRLTRAKGKIRKAGIPYIVPEAVDIPDRLEPVLSVIYLIYNESYTAYEGMTLTRNDLAAEAIRLTQILQNLLPNPEVSGLLALMILQNARRPARTDMDGNLVSLEVQDRALWDGDAIAVGKKLLLRAMGLGRIGPYQIQAAINALHCEAVTWADTDWPQISKLYTTLFRLNPSPVIALNGAIAMANGGQLAAGLQAIEALATDLLNYQPFYAARADLLARKGDFPAAHADYARAIEMSKNTAERAFLQRKQADLG